MIQDFWPNALFSVTPTILVGLIFWLVMRGIFRADRTERSVYARIESEERAKRGLSPVERGADATGAAITGAAIADAAVTGAAVTGAAVTGTATPGAATSSSAATDSAASGTPKTVER